MHMSCYSYGRLQGAVKKLILKDLEEDSSRDREVGLFRPGSTEGHRHQQSRETCQHGDFREQDGQGKKKEGKAG